MYADNSKATADPFSEENDIEVKEEKSTIKIEDIETAKICGIKEDNKDDGYPIEGTIAGVGDSNLRLRSWPWGDVIGKFSSGTSVKVLGESGEFYLVEVNGQQGYMHKNYITTSMQSASGEAPYYPADTRSGGSLSLEEGVKASNDGAKLTFTDPGDYNITFEDDNNNNSDGKKGNVSVTNDKVLLDVPKNYQMTANVPAPGSACGPTSLSMVLGFYGKGDPKVLVTDLYNVSGCTKANGTGHDGLVKAAKKYGMNNAKWHYSCTQDFCRQTLKEGKPMICHVNHHYVVLKGMDSNGNVIINDPGKSVIERTMSWSEFASWWSKSNSPMSAMTCE